MVYCAVGGVQPQSETVWRQADKYKVPRIAFINKCDRSGANPMRVTAQLREKLGHNAVLMQIPIGLEAGHEGMMAKALADEGTIPASRVAEAIARYGIEVRY